MHKLPLKKTALAASTAVLLGMTSFGGAALVPSVSSAQTMNYDYTVQFALGSARLDQSAMSTIRQAAQAFKQGNSASITLVGHADTTGNPSLNQRLSEARAQAVENALIAEGISPTAISTEAVGEQALIVPTADGVAEQQNRVVTVSLERPPEPAPAVAAVVPTTEEVTDTFKRFSIDIGPYYGFNMQADRHLLGGNISADIFVTRNISIGAEQAGFYVFDEGIGGRSVGSLDFHFDSGIGIGSVGNLVPYLGANVGGIYGEGIYDDIIYGPEIGFDFGFMTAKVAWDISDAGVDDSTISAIIGGLLRF